LISTTAGVLMVRMHVVGSAALSLLLLLLAPSASVASPADASLPGGAPITVLVPSYQDLLPEADAKGSVHEPLNALIASAPNGSLIEFPRDEVYRVDFPLEVDHKSDVELWFKGSTITTPRPTPYKDAKLDRARAHLRINSCDNIKVTGLRVHGPHAVDQPYSEALEAQHGIEIQSSTAVRIRDLEVDGVWGDGVYASSHGDTGEQTRGVDVSQFAITAVGRHAFGLTSADFVAIHDGWLSNPRRAVLDLEPSGTRGSISVVHFYNVTFGGGGLYFVASVGSGTVNGVVVEDVTALGRGLQSVVSPNLDRDPNAVRKNFAFRRLTSDVEYAGNHGGVLTFFHTENVWVDQIDQPLQPRRDMQIARFFDCTGTLEVDGVPQVSEVGSAA